MVLHDQNIDITEKIDSFENYLSDLGYKNHAVHTAPLIRREAFYSNDLMSDRKKLFNALYGFFRKLDINYISIIVDKKDCRDNIVMTHKLSKAIAAELNKNLDFYQEFDAINIYYDNGQIELTKILVSVFTALLNNVDFRKVQPVDYKLFQVADLICTMELLAIKSENNTLTKSELDFFGGKRDLNKNYLKQFRRKHL